MRPEPKHFRCPDTQRLFEEKRIPRFVNISRVAIRKLQQLNAAATLSFLQVPPSNRLEALKGDRRGQYSLHINNQWRICFVWRDGHVCDVEIVDYH